MKDYTHIAIILDRSGSMSSIANEIIGGFNAFMEDQIKAPGTATLTLVQFDNEIDRLETFKPLQEVKQLTSETYRPRGMTKLYDAIGLTVGTVQDEILKINEADRPEKVLVVILTDGLENSSQEYTVDKVKSLLDQKQKDGWEFSFIGANQDAVMTGRGLNLNNAASNLTFAATPQGASQMMKSLSSATRAYRSSPKGAFAYSNEDKASQSLEPAALHASIQVSLGEKVKYLGSSGGVARAASLTPERRKEISSTAAKARWSRNSV